MCNYFDFCVMLSVILNFIKNAGDLTPLYTIFRTNLIIASLSDFLMPFLLTLCCYLKYVKLKTV